MLNTRLRGWTPALAVALLAILTAAGPGCAGKTDRIDLKKYIGPYTPVGSNVARLGKVDRVEIRQDFCYDFFILLGSSIDDS